MIPLSEKKVKRSSGKSNTICENRRKNKSLVKYVLQKNSQGLPVRALFVPKTGSKCVCRVPAVRRRAAKPCVLPAGQLPFLRTERLPLHAHLPRRYFTNVAASHAYFANVAALLPSAASARMYFPEALLRYARMRIFYRLFTPIISRK